MTREELVKIIREFILKHNAWDNPCDVLADRILSALEAEENPSYEWLKGRVDFLENNADQVAQVRAEDIIKLEKSKEAVLSDMEKAKPTAEAGLVEEVDSAIVNFSRTYRSKGEDKVKAEQVSYEILGFGVEIRNILSRYRPTEDGLREEVKAWRNKWNPKPAKWERAPGRNWEMWVELSKIIAGHPTPEPTDKGEDGATPAEELESERWMKIMDSHPAKAEEPLAVLADRKGYQGTYLGRYVDGWILVLWKTYKELGQRIIIATSDIPYPEAEAKARAYLNGLPDKEGI